MSLAGAAAYKEAAEKALLSVKSGFDVQELLGKGTSKVQERIDLLYKDFERGTDANLPTVLEKHAVIGLRVFVRGMQHRNLDGDVWEPASKEQLA